MNVSSAFRQCSQHVTQTLKIGVILAISGFEYPNQTVQVIDWLTHDMDLQSTVLCQRLCIKPAQGQGKQAACQCSNLLEDHKAFRVT
jgi:hypothetical protein